jgi:CheY-like chemotaxis protein
MDHEMPGMDGTETTAAIRALGRDYVQDLPVIALTANDVSGLREYFLARKFNDYLLKPLSAPRLCGILEKWIPPEKRLAPGAYTPPPEIAEPGEEAARDRAASSLVIKNVDTARGLAMTGGAEAGYRAVLASFYRDARGRLDFFLELPKTETLPVFINQAHALKSASAVIGAAKVSAGAAALEAAGKEGDIGAIEDRLPAFYEDLSDLVSAVGGALGIYGDYGDETDPPAVSEEDPARPPVCRPKFRELREAIEREDIAGVNRLLAGLESEALTPRDAGILALISDQILMAEFGAAIETIDKLLRNGG